MLPLHLHLNRHHNRQGISQQKFQNLWFPMLPKRLNLMMYIIWGFIKWWCEYNNSCRPSVFQFECNLLWDIKLTIPSTEGCSLIPLVVLLENELVIQPYLKYFVIPCCNSKMMDSFFTYKMSLLDKQVNVGGIGIVLTQQLV